MSCKKIIDLWPSFVSMGRDIGESDDMVRKCYNRNSIPASKLGAILRAAKKRAHAGNRRFNKVTADWLIRMVSATE